MASSIDPSQPPASNPTTAALRANMAAAKSEIEALQANKVGFQSVNGATVLVKADGAEIKTNGFDLLYKDMSISVPTATSTLASTITTSKDVYGAVSNTVNGYFKIPSWATNMEMAINVDWSDPAAAAATVRFIGIEIEVSADNWFAFGIPGYPVLNVVGFETHQAIYIGAFESVASNTGKNIRVYLYQGSGNTLNQVHLHVGVKFGK